MLARILCLTGLAALVVFAALTEKRPALEATAVLGSGDSLAAVITGVYGRSEDRRRKKAKTRAAQHQPAAKARNKKVAKRNACGKPGPACPVQHAKLRNLKNGYRTLCVRLCDGFYYPISAAAQPGEFARDEEACRASCASPAMLFVYKNRGGSPETMIDLEGRPYTDLMTAFQYRVAYDTSCSCRAAPWTEEAANRHRLYELESAAAEGDQSGEIERSLLAAVVEQQEKKARARTGADLVVASAAAQRMAAKAAPGRAERSAKRKAAGRVPVVRTTGRENVRKVRVVRVSASAVRSERRVQVARIRVSDARVAMRVHR